MKHKLLKKYSPKLITKNTEVQLEDNLEEGFVKYHQTKIVEWNENTITLRTGGYFTQTTKKKMNLASKEFDLGFKIKQKEFDWFILDRRAHCFAKFDTESITINREIFK